MLIYYKDNQISIRDLCKEDVTALFSWWIDKEINRFDPRPIPGSSMELVKECNIYCEMFNRDIMGNESERKYRYFIICDMENRPIGFVNFFSVDKEKKQCELGVAIGDKRYWKKGIALKAVTIVIDYIFTNLSIDRIYIETGENNEPALGLFSKLGFINCGEDMDCGFKFIVMEKRNIPV